MNIMYVSAEVEPFAKSGGLGDVVGALPHAVKGLGHKVFVVLPKYTRLISAEYQQKMEYLGYMYVDVNWRHQYCGVFRLKMRGVTYFFIDNEYYFGGDLYCFADNERFTFLSKACLDLIGFLKLHIDVLHCNDWSTGIVPVLFDAFYRKNDFYKNIKLVYTVHNLRYQGKMGIPEAQDYTGLPIGVFLNDKLVKDGAVNYMKGAIVFSDAVTTVSPTYAAEIKTEAFSENLGEEINQNQHKLFGILNGVDYRVYNPKKDNLIFRQYGKKDLAEGKLQNKLDLQRSLNLPEDGNVLLVGLVSRLVDQKGLDLVGEILGRMLECNVQFVVLGTGEKRYEDLFRHFAGRYPQKMSANLTFSNKLAHKIYAACDLLLVPSAFEPCGLSQMIALKYGTLPLVRETGGLRDSVLSYNEETGEGNGFSFRDYNANDLWHTVLRAMRLYYDRKDIWKKILKNALKCDFSWKESSKKYEELYCRLTGTPVPERKLKK